MKRFSTLISGYEKSLDSLKTKKQKLIVDHKETLKALETEILETKNDLAEAKKQQDNSDIHHIRDTPTLWDKFCDDYAQHDYMEGNSYLGFAPEDAEDVNRYFHLTRPELETVVDFCIEHRAQYEPHKRRDSSFEFTFKRDPYRYTEMHDKIKPLKVDQICTVSGLSRGNGFFVIYLHRKSPPLDRSYIERFKRMVKSYQPPQP